MNVQNIQELGQALRRRRKELKVTQKDLAMTCGTGPRFIVDLERGKPTCHVGKALLVVRALGLEVVLLRVGSEPNAGDSV